MIVVDSPRCSECARPLSGICEPFIGGVPQHHRCPGCLVHLRVCRTSAGWTVTTAARSAGQGEPGSVPAVASPVLRHRFLGACLSVRELLCQSGPVEPGLASIGDPPGREVMDSLGVSHGAVSGDEVSWGSYTQPLVATTGKRGTAVPE